MNILCGNLLGRTEGDRRDLNGASPEYKSQALSVEKIRLNLCKTEPEIMESTFIETMDQFPRMKSENERTINETKKKVVYFVSYNFSQNEYTYHK